MLVHQHLILLYKDASQRLKEFGANEVIEYNGVEENVKFNLPKEIVAHEKSQSN